MSGAVSSEGRWGRSTTSGKRIQIRIDERTHLALRRRAFEKGCSVSSLVRELLGYSLDTRRPKQRTSIKDFSFIDAGRSRQGRLLPVSERHDEAQATAVHQRKKSWAALGKSLDKFANDFMKNGRNQPHIQKRGRPIS